MGKGKIKKFKEINTLPNVFQNPNYRNPVLIDSEGDIADLKGEWKRQYFGNDNPLILELACGKGEYTLGMAERFPNKNFIGVDIKGARIWFGARKAFERGIKNTGFVRAKIELIDHFFAPEEVDEIWITFPDPFPKKEIRRLTSPYFLEKYIKICKRDALFHLKTDDIELFEYSMKTLESNGFTILESIDGVYSDGNVEGLLGIKTYYESMFLEEGREIRYLQSVIQNSK